MAITGKVRTLFTDKTQSEALFPKTKVSAISDENGVGLDSILSEMIYTGDVVEDATGIVNADTLGGRPASDFPTANEVIYTGENEDTDLVPLNADTLGGIPADEYATENFVVVKIAEAQMGGGSDGNIDLSGYATKDDVSNAIRDVDFPVDSVNGKTGAVQLSAADVGAVDVNKLLFNAAIDAGQDVLKLPNGTYSFEGNIDDTVRNQMHLPCYSWHYDFLITSGQWTQSSGTDTNIYKTILCWTHEGDLYVNRCSWDVWQGWKKLLDSDTTASEVGALALDGSNALKKSGGYEGGQLNLEKPDTSDLGGNVAIDSYANRVRFFENGGGYRGAYIDLTKCTPDTKIYHAGDKPTASEVGAIPGMTTPWLPYHGMTLEELPDGFFAYSVNPGNMVSVGAPTNFSEYGTIFGIKSTEYNVYLYSDVFGKFAVRDNMNGQWIASYSQNNKPTASDVGIRDFNWTLLWQNAAENSTFTPQTICNVANYDAVMIVTRLSTNYGYENNAMLLTHGWGGAFISYPKNAMGITGGPKCRRFDVTSDGSLNVGDGYTDGSVDNNACVPVVVYGANWCQTV